MNTHIDTCTRTTSALPIHYYLGVRATLGLIVSCSYCAAHLWRSHYKIHKLFSHVPALFTLSSLQLVQHNCLKSPSPLCSIDRIKQLLLIRKSHRAPKDRRIETKRYCKLLHRVFDLAVIISLSGVVKPKSYIKYNIFCIL